MVTTPATAKNVLSVGVSTTGTGGTTPQEQLTQFLGMAQRWMAELSQTLLRTN